MENRFEGASWYPIMKTQNAAIVGLGATGTFFAFFLARAGVNNVKLVDFDSFESHNFGSQLISQSAIGTNKAVATRDMLFKFTNVPNIFTSQVRVEETFYSSEIVVCTLDSMSGRKYMFEQFLTDVNQKLFIDTRISAEYWEVYAITKNNQENIAKYKETLFSDEQGNVGACNYQQSSHSAAGAAIQGVELITNYLNNILMDDDYLPFKCSKDLRTQNYQCSY